jgi:2-keto-4-pentenoate hydratase/2-oxohepta-3-ene-1,7-dioic acid hydratase in catechol pathway
LDPVAWDGLDADLSPLGPPVTAPAQIFAVGLNYLDHRTETGPAVPTQPLTFTKFASAFAGPSADMPLPTTTCDWEIELVAVIGRPGRTIAADEAPALSNGNASYALVSIC